MNELILLVSHRPSFSLEIASLLQDSSSAWNLRVASESAALFSLVRKAQPKVVLISHELPDFSRDELIEQILRLSPATRILILAPDANLVDIRSAIKKGVAGYLLRAEAQTDLVLAVSQLINGHFYASRSILLMIFSDYHASLVETGLSAHIPLSPRERQVLQCIAEGCGRKAIALQLNIGVRSVETYRRRLTAKTGCKTTSEFRQYAQQEGYAANVQFALLGGRHGQPATTRSSSAPGEYST
jgi:DNA-binding NarL/FixJ family response regulator